MNLTFNPEENSTISSAWMFLRPYTRAIPSPMLSTRPVSSKSAFGAAPIILSSRIEEISAALWVHDTCNFLDATDTAGIANLEI